MDNMPYNHLRESRMNDWVRLSGNVSEPVQESRESGCQNPRACNFACHPPQSCGPRRSQEIPHRTQYVKSLHVFSSPRPSDLFKSRKCLYYRCISMITIIIIDRRWSFFPALSSSAMSCLTIMRAGRGWTNMVSIYSHPHYEWDAQLIIMYYFTWLWVHRENKC